MTAPLVEMTTPIVELSYDIVQQLYYMDSGNYPTAEFNRNWMVITDYWRVRRGVLIIHPEWQQGVPAQEGCIDNTSPQVKWLE